MEFLAWNLKIVVYEIVMRFDGSNFHDMIQSLIAGYICIEYPYFKCYIG